MTSSTMLMPSLRLHIFETLNGRVQVSLGASGESIGLLVERGIEGVGTLITLEQAREIAAVLSDATSEIYSPLA